MDDLKLTDVEWRDFQAIPDQGYSHRAWVDHKIDERVRRAIRDLASRVASENPGVPKITADNWARWIRTHADPASPDTRLPEED